MFCCFTCSQSRSTLGCFCLGWFDVQEGQDPDVIAETLGVMAAAEPVVVDALRWSDLPDPLPRNILKLHVPPRASNKITQTIRHTAAKAVAQLGLQVGGTARLELHLRQPLAALHCCSCLLDCLDTLLAL